MFTDILKIIPHRAPVVMIDGYQKTGEDSAISEKTFRPGDYGLNGSQVAESILIECMAQTVAAHSGYDSLSKGQAQGETGMLVSVDAFNVFGRVGENARIQVTVEKTNSVGAFKIYKGQVYLEEKLVAEGTLKLFIEGNKG